MARRATSLGPKPSLFLFLWFFLFFVWFFGGFKGHVRWPEGPPHLALNPPYFCIFVLLFLSFVGLSWLLIEKLVFPLENGFFCLFLSLPFVSPWPFLASPFFCFSFSVSLSLSLSLSLSCSCLSFFLSFFFAFFWFIVFVSCFVFVSSSLLFHEKNNIKIFNSNFLFLINLFSFLEVSCLVLPFRSLFLIFVVS